MTKCKRNADRDNDCRQHGGEVAQELGKAELDARNSRTPSGRPRRLCTKASRQRARRGHFASRPCYFLGYNAGLGGVRELFGSKVRVRVHVGQ